MIKWLVLFLLLLPTAAHGYFNVTIGSSVTGAPDTVTIAWSGITADSLVVRYDPYGYPDDDGLGIALYYNGGDASLEVSVLDTLPGDFLYFSLMKYASSTWSQEATDLVFVQDQARAYPRIGAMWLQGGKNLVTAGMQDSVSVFDIFIQNGHDVLDGTVATQIAELDTLHDLNPEIKIVTHEYIDSWNIHRAHDFLYWQDGDTASFVYWTVLKDMMVDSSVCPFWLVDTMTVQGALGTGSSIKVDAVPSAITAFYPIGTNAHRYYLLYWDVGGTNEFQILRLNTTNETDSLFVDRLGGRLSSTGGNLNISNGDELYLLTNSEIQSGVALMGGDNKLRGTRGDFDLWQGLEPLAVQASIMANTWKDLVAVDGDTILDVYMWDVFFSSHNTHTRSITHGTFNSLDDSALYNAAAAFRSVQPLTDLAGNMQNSGLSGVEDELINAPCWGESQFGTLDSRWPKNGIGDSQNGGRDLAMETLTRSQAGKYRYSTRSDNWPDYWSQFQAAFNNKGRYRTAFAMANMLGAYSTQKKPWDALRLFWADEFWVDSDGQSVWADTLDADRWWLGWPIEPVQPIIQSGSFPDTLSDGDMESASVIADYWTSSDTDSVTVARTTRSAYAGSYGLEIQIADSMGYKAHGDWYPHFYAWDEYVQYRLAAPPNGMDVVDNGSYTLKFMARVGGSNNTGTSNDRIMWVRLKSSDVLYSASFHVPQMWKQIYIPVLLDIDHDDFTDVDVQFGVKNVLRSDKADTIYIDNLALTVGSEFGGFYRRYDNGMILASMASESITVQMPDPDSTYIRIKADTLHTWSDESHNDSSFVLAELDMGPEEAFYLFGTAAPAETVDPDAVIGVVVTDTTTTSFDLKWNVVDSTDATGYMVRYNQSDTSPADEDAGLLVGTTNSRTDTAMTHSGRTDNTEYSYTVMAFDAAGNYSTPNDSSKVTVTTLTEPQGTSVSISDRGDADYSGKTFDTFIDQNDPTANKGSQTTLWTWNESGNNGYSYLLINLTGLFAENTVVDSAFLDLYAIQVQDIEGYFYLYDMNHTWADSTATWNSPSGDATPWSVQKGIGAEKLDSLAMPTAGAFYSYTVTEETQEAINLTTAPTGHLNVTVRKNVEQASSGASYASTDHATAAWRPQLRVYYHLRPAIVDTPSFIHVGRPPRIGIFTP